MNVNPFSYLIEKLKGKVNKSGDTMTGTLNIEATTDTPLTLKRTNSSSSVMLNFYNQNGIVGGYVAGNDGKPYYRKSDGTYPQIALTSDLPTTTHGTIKTITSSNATINYYEDICGNVVHVRISVDPSASVGAGNIESVTLDLAHPPLDKETATSSMTASSSDRKPLNIGILNSTKTFEIWGAMTSGRNGAFSFTYII